MKTAPKVSWVFSMAQQYKVYISNKPQALQFLKIHIVYSDCLKLYRFLR